MPPSLKGLGLAERDMKKARVEAGIFLGKDPPIWNSLGADIQRAKVASYLEHLRETDNCYIADKLLQDEDVVFEFLRTRIKVIRNTKKGSSQSNFNHLLCSRPSTIGPTFSASSPSIPRDDAKPDPKIAEDSNVVGDRHEDGQGGTSNPS